MTFKTIIVLSKHSQLLLPKTFFVFLKLHVTIAPNDWTNQVSVSLPTQNSPPDIWFYAPVHSVISRQKHHTLVWIINTKLFGAEQKSSFIVGICLLHVVLWMNHRGVVVQWQQRHMTKDCYVETPQMTFMLLLSYVSVAFKPLSQQAKWKQYQSMAKTRLLLKCAYPWQFRTLHWSNNATANTLVASDVWLNKIFDFKFVVVFVWTLCVDK